MSGTVSTLEVKFESRFKIFQKELARLTFLSRSLSLAAVLSGASLELLERREMKGSSCQGAHIWQQSALPLINSRRQGGKRLDLLHQHLLHLHQEKL